MEINNIELLAKLLKESNEDECDEELDCERPKVSPYMTPGAIGGSSSAKATEVNDNQWSSSKDIWQIKEAPVMVQNDHYDPRPSPEYNIKFKQSVAAEDVFLGMGVKSPATSSCEEIVVDIILPGTVFKDINLDVTETFLDCRTPDYKLGLHLPHKVDHINGKAKWIKEEDKLEVTLKLTREYDFLNFEKT